MDQLRALYKQHFCQTPSFIQELPSAGSNRRYFRMTGADGGTVIGSVGTSVKENNAFHTISEHFVSKGLPVPKVLAVSGDGLRYLQEDLGNSSLYDAVASGRESGSYSEHERQLLRSAVSLLPRLQFEGGEGFDYSVCYPQEAFDARMVAFDLNYFKYCFLKGTGVDFDENLLEDEFLALGRRLMEGGGACVGGAGGACCAGGAGLGWHFMYRDFQARNVMLVGEKPYFIDFQGGRRGPIFYDLASFVWQARAGYPTDLKRELVDTYVEALQPYLGGASLDKDGFMSTLRRFVLFRTLQVLGAYGFRGFFERKSHFLQSVPYAMDNLREVLSYEDIVSEYPYLSSVLLKVAGLPRFAHPVSSSDGILDVLIYSFSYKKGIPEDLTGNGGGYVFDCRSIANPGRYPQYAHSTGMDADVRKFFEDDGSVFPYLDHVYAIADSHVQRYISRGFTHLMFSFGCTGGQHRSVFCAESLASYLSSRFSGQIRIRVIHRERGIERTFGVKDDADMRVDGGDRHAEVCNVPRTAMILAAGLGTRLRPLTDKMPKALVPYHGSPLLGQLLDKLSASGFTRVVINVHHFADMIEQYVSDNRQRWPMEILISDERDLLRDTGGGIRHAASLLGDVPFLVHNVDIVSDIDLRALYDGFVESQRGTASAASVSGVASTGSVASANGIVPTGASVSESAVSASGSASHSGLDTASQSSRVSDSLPLASLLVSDRTSSRYFLFSEDNALAGWTNVRTGEVKSPLPDFTPASFRPLAFSGIHILSPRVFQLMSSWPEAFSIVDFYLSALQSSRIQAVIASSDCHITDVGKLEQLG